jgi:hypothetical protein
MRSCSANLRASSVESGTTSCGSVPTEGHLHREALRCRESRLFSLRSLCRPPVPRQRRMGHPPQMHNQPWTLREQPKTPPRRRGSRLLWNSDRRRHHSQLHRRLHSQTSLSHPHHHRPDSSHPHTRPTTDPHTRTSLTRQDSSLRHRPTSRFNLANTRVPQPLDFSLILTEPMAHRSTAYPTPGHLRTLHPNSVSHTSLRDHSLRALKARTSSNDNSTRPHNPTTLSMRHSMPSRLRKLASCYRRSKCPRKTRRVCILSRPQRQTILKCPRLLAIDISHRLEG